MPRKRKLISEVEWDWDAWASDPPYAELNDDAMIKVWRPSKNTPVVRIRLRDVPKDIDTVGLWWRPAGNARRGAGVDMQYTDGSRDAQYQ